MHYDISLIEYPGEVCLVLYHNECNLSCPHCFNGDIPYDNKLSFSSVVKAIEESEDFITAVCLTGGEPTLSPYFKKICKYISDKGLKLKINTNGIFSEHIPFAQPYKKYINLSIKGDFNYYQTCGIKNKDDLIKRLYSTSMKGAITEWNLVYGQYFFDIYKVYNFLMEIRDYNTHGCLFDRVCRPDYFTIKQLQTGNCLDENLNSWKIPSRDELINIAKIFANIPKKDIYIETYEFGREKLNFK